MADNPNGFEADQALIERVISAVVRFNELARGLVDSLDSLSDRQSRDCETIRQEIRTAHEKHTERLIVILSHLQEARVGIDKVREDQTDPQGFRLLSAADLKPPKNDSGGAIVAVARLAEKMPASWAIGLLKLGVSAGLGGALLRLAQFLTSGH